MSRLAVVALIAWACSSIEAESVPSRLEPDLTLGINSIAHDPFKAGTLYAGATWQPVDG